MMARRMSCAMTIPAVQDRTKTVTRRHIDTWTTLEPGDRLTLIEKGMGLPKGAKQVVLAEVEVTDVRDETLRDVTVAEVMAEGLIERALLEGSTTGLWDVSLMGEDEWVVLWFRAFWASGHLPGSLREWAVGRLASSLLGVECRRIEWRYLDEDGAP